MSAVIPWAKPTLFGNETEAVTRALQSTWISGGPYVEEFESRLAELCEVPNVLAVANGTAAIHLAYLGLGIQPGDEVIVPGFGFQAAANVALLMNARPVFADVDKATWCVTAETIRPRLSPRTRAIVPVHTYGNVCPMDDIRALADRHGVPVVEDVAEAFLSRYAGRPAGAFGTVGCFSFQATKTITTGEGGLVVTPDRQLYERMALYRSHGMLKKRYWHEVPGHNFRLTNLQAALGCAQLDHVPHIVAERSRLHREYTARLAGERGLTLQVFPAEVSPVLWAMAVCLGPWHYPQGRDAVLDGMLRLGVETRPGFYSPEDQPIYAGNTSPLPVGTPLAGDVLSLPTYPGLTADELDRICRALLSQRGGAIAPAA